LDFEYFVPPLKNVDISDLRYLPVNFLQKFVTTTKGEIIFLSTLTQEYYQSLSFATKCLIVNEWEDYIIVNLNEINQIQN